MTLFDYVYIDKRIKKTEENLKKEIKQNSVVSADNSVSYNTVYAENTYTAELGFIAVLLIIFAVIAVIEG